MLHYYLCYPSLSVKVYPSNRLLQNLDQPGSFWFREQFPVSLPCILFRAVVPASFAGIAAVRSHLEIGILALCTDRLIMLHSYGRWFLIHENWMLFYYLDIPCRGSAKGHTFTAQHLHYHSGIIRR